MHPIQIIGGLPYEQVRERCHAIKEHDDESLKRSSRVLFEALRKLENPVLLIPVPSHTGEATYLMDIANFIRLRAFRARYPLVIGDYLQSHPHKSFNERKHAGDWPKDGDVKMRWKNTYSQTLFEYYVKDLGCTPVLVDNVVDTGVTARACMKVTGECPVLCLGCTGNCETEPFKLLNKFNK